MNPPPGAMAITQLEVQVVPRARRTEIAGRLGEALKIRVAAPPVEGAANRELVRFLAEALGLPRSAVSIRSGAAGRRKRIEIRGLAPAEVRARLAI